MAEIDLNDLADRVEKLKAADNAVDVLVEIALFEPSETSVAIRPNAAGTKVIYSYADESSMTYWAEEWTGAAYKQETCRLLRERAAALRARLREGEG